MIKNLKPIYIVMLLSIATLGLYYRSLLQITHHPVMVGTDDQNLVFSLLNHKLTLRDIFLTKGAGKYYRPFLGLSFLIDQRLWGDSIPGYRLTNILIHVFNVILLYLTAGVFFAKIRLQDTAAPFIAAILFAVHPALVESVSWISGRTDALATFWSLLALLCYIHFKENGRWYLVLLSVLCSLAAILSKEVAIMVPVLMSVFEMFYCQNFGYKRENFSYVIVVLNLAILITYFLLRHSTLSGSDSGLSILAKDLFSKQVSALLNFMASFGFYVKKFIFPFPLSFVITEINTRAYAFAGLIVLLLFIFLLISRSTNYYQFFYLWALFGLIPAALVSTSDIAWTPWAERYLYFSSVPFSIMCGILTSSATIGNTAKKIVQTSSALVLVIFAVATAERSVLWNDENKLWEDSIKKSPTFIYAAVEYANSFARRGLIEESEKRLENAMNLPGPKHLVFYSMGNISRYKGDDMAAEKYYSEALREARMDNKLVTVGPTFRKDILTALADIEINRAAHAHSNSDKQTHYRRAISNLLNAYKEDSSDKFLLYRAGKLYLILGLKSEAASYFKMFCSSGGNDCYTSAASRMIDRIETR